MKHKRLFIILSVIVLALLVGAAVPPALRERIAIYAREDSWIANGFDIIWYTGNLTGESARVDGANGRIALIAPTAIGTATPVLDIRNNGVSESLVVRNSGGTPVFYVDKDGAATYSGFSSGGGAITAPVGITAPTAVGTATPALMVNSLGAGNVLLDVSDASTPVFSVNNGGNWTATGGGTNNNWAVVSAPTAIATATPAMVVDSLGVSNILEVRDAATPVFTVNNGGGFVAAGTGDLQGNVDFDALIVPSFADETITDGEVLTPTVMVYALDSSGAVTMTLAASASEGQLLILIGDDANAIVINDTNVRTSTGAALTLNQYDVVMWVYQDAEWIEIALLTDS